MRLKKKHAFRNESAKNRKDGEILGYPIGLGNVKERYIIVDSCQSKHEIRKLEGEHITKKERKEIVD